MRQSPFHIYYTARMLASYAGEDALVPALASSDMEIYPYQIAAARFALRSPYLPGCILGDECSLGKTYEALLIATQLWYDGKTRQLLILPVNMIGQWTEKLENSFSIPYVVMDTQEAFQRQEGENPFAQDALVITSYDFAVEKADAIGELKWHIVIFDEANCLNKAYTGENKTATTLKRATDGCFKLLLTATPIELSVMDIYGLLYFIDETLLPDDPDTFYHTYFRRPDRYAELGRWVSPYCFRTLKSQVTAYVNFTNRVPYTLSCDFTKEEKRLYEEIMAYVKKTGSLAYPDKTERDVYNMTIQWGHILSSSPQAIGVTLRGAVKRLQERKPADAEGQERYEAELALLTDLQKQAQGIQMSGKMKTLLAVLKKCFARLRQIKASQKAILFTDNLTTMVHLSRLLTEKGYAVLTYSGEKARDYSIMKRFRQDQDVQILIATDDMAKGLDIEFCPVVINYDLLTNAPEMEQRICRCHRQGQRSDVLVVNLVSKDNYADIRCLELINKRVAQFDGIFGMSDTILGNFDAAVDDVLAALRPAGQIQTAFSQNLLEHEAENTAVVEQAENALFTTFTKEVAEKVTLLPRYLEKETQKLNDDLWEVVKYFFKQYNVDQPVFQIDEAERTVTLLQPNNPPVLFTYMIDQFPRKPKFQRYRSISKYGMDKHFLPHQGRIALAGFLSDGILKAVPCEERGTLTVDGDIEDCVIGLYGVTIAPKEKIDWTNDAIYRWAFAGQTASGRILSDEECRRIMELSVVEYTEQFIIDERQKREAEKEGRTYQPTRHSLQDRIGYTQPKPCPLDDHLSVVPYVREQLEKQKDACAEEIERLKLRMAKRKAALDQELETLKDQVEKLEQEAGGAVDRVTQMRAQRQLRLLQKERMEKEDKLFLNGLRLDAELEEQIKQFVENSDWAGKARRHYLIQVTGNN